jgi:RNA polymerase sigma-70 factor (ECF subfamily)
MRAHARTVSQPDDPIAELIDAGSHREAIAMCVAEHGGSVGRLCMALLGSQSDAEEVVQETFLAAHGALASYRGEGSIRSWLFGIARRQCARHLERRRRHQRKLEVVPDDPSATGPDGRFTRKQRAVAVRDALERIKPSEREALLLRYQAGLSFREIGDACGIAEAAARKRASRGLQHLRTILTPEDVE